MSKYNYATSFRLATVFGWSYRPRTDLLVNTLVLEGIQKGKIEVYQGNFNRNYIHVNDIVRAFMFCIDRKATMMGQVYNLGNDSINMTKLDLVKKICAILDVGYEEVTGSDQDKRDYLVSSKKLYESGYDTHTTLEMGVRELTNAYKSCINFCRMDLDRQGNY